MLDVFNEGFEGRAVAYANARRFTPVGVRTVLLLLAPVKEVHPVHLAVNCQ